MSQSRNNQALAFLWLNIVSYCFCGGRSVSALAANQSAVGVVGDTKGSISLVNLFTGSQTTKNSTFTGTSQTIGSMARVNESVFAVGTDDRLVIFFDIGINSQLYVLQTGHTDKISGLVVKPNGKYMITASLSGDGSSKVFDLSQNYRSVVNFTQSTGHVYGIDILDGYDHLVATASTDTNIYIWNYVNGTVIRIITQSYPLYSLKQCAQNILAVGNSIDEITLWFISNGTLFKTLSDHHNVVGQILTFTDVTLVASDAKGYIYVWNWLNSTMLSSVVAFSRQIQRMALNSDAILFATFDSTNIFKSWYLSDTAFNLTEILNTELTTPDDLVGVLPLTEYQYIPPAVKQTALVGSDWNILFLLDAPNGTEKSQFYYYHDDVNISIGCLIKVNESMYAACYNPDQADVGVFIGLIDSSTFDLIETINKYQHNKTITSLAMASGQVLISASLDGTARSWNLSDLPNQIGVPYNQGDSIMALCVLSSGLVATASFSQNDENRGGVTVWNWRNNSIKYQFYLESGGAYSLCELSPTRLAVGTDEQDQIKVYDLTNGSLVFSLQGHQGYVTSFQLLSSKLLIAGDETGTIKKWDLLNRVEVESLDLFNSAVTGMDLALGSTMLIVVSLKDERFSAINVNKSGNFSIAYELDTINFKPYAVLAIDWNESDNLTTTTSTTTTTTPSKTRVSTSTSTAADSSLANFTFSNLTDNQLTYLLESGIDLTDCLNNCSNRGMCMLYASQLICVCDPPYDGSSCATNTDPCSSSPCLNGGSCLSDMATLEFQCTCDQSYYYGSYCEQKIDLCANMTCSGHGKCQDKGTTANCVCFYLYSGDECEIESNNKKMVKTVVSTSTVVAFIALALFYSIFIVIDLVNLVQFIRELSMGKQKRHTFKFNYKS